MLPVQFGIHGVTESCQGAILQAFGIHVMRVLVRFYKSCKSFGSRQSVGEIFRELEEFRILAECWWDFARVARI